MTTAFVHSFQSESLKIKRSLAFWIVVVGAFFTPTIIIIARIVHYAKLPALYGAPDFWNHLWQNSWESMAIFLLPLGVMLTTSLITQLEYKNNTWKQVHTLPVSFTVLFFSKLSVLLVMMLAFFMLFNFAIYLSALIPYLIISGVPYPSGAIPFAYFLEHDVKYFINCLPIVALQYLLSLKYKNFLVSIGAGFILWIGALGALSCEYGYFVPYSYPMYTYLKSGVVTKATIPSLNIEVLSMIYFVVITAISFFLYLYKKEKG